MIRRTFFKAAAALLAGLGITKATMATEPKTEKPKGPTLLYLLMFEDNDGSSGGLLLDNFIHHPPVETLPGFQRADAIVLENLIGPTAVINRFLWGKQRDPEETALVAPVRSFTVDEVWCHEGGRVEASRTFRVKNAHLNLAGWQTVADNVTLVTRVYMMAEEVLVSGDAAKVA